MVAGLGSAPKPALGLVLTALLAGLALAGCLDEGSSYNGRNDSTGSMGFKTAPFPREACEVEASSQSVKSNGDPLVLAAEVRIRESEPTEDRWWGQLRFTWHKWPEPGLLGGGPESKSPGDRHVEHVWLSRLGEEDRVTDRLKLAWDRDDFSSDGTYEGRLTLEMKKMTRSKLGDWKTLCVQSEEVGVRFRMDRGLGP